MASSDEVCQKIFLPRASVKILNIKGLFTPSMKFDGDNTMRHIFSFPWKKPMLSVLTVFCLMTFLISMTDG